MTDVRTTAGWLRGHASPDRVLAFLGIPYGQAERFRAPSAAPAWTGIRDAAGYGPSCPQPTMPGPESESALALFGGILEPSMSEDCLVLNVWTPATDDARRPVLVYLHGGGHATGSGSWPVYEGAALAGRGAVVVTVNHRLGVLGYLHLSHLLGAEFATSGANGMLDVVLALQWVRDNVAAFGGDPDNVTVFGESGGGSKVATLFAMPAARGLYHRAIIMSGWFGLQGKEPAQAAQLTARALGLLGIDESSAAELLTMPVESIVAASAAMGGIDSGLYPVIDAEVITAQPIEAVRSGATAGVALIIGTVRDEYSMFLPFIALFAGGPPDEAIDSYLISTFGPEARPIIARYAQLRPDLSPDQIRVAVATDGNVRVPAIRMADAKAAADGNVYMYRFDFQSPLDPTLGAAHGLDVPFVFDTADTAAVTGTAADRALLVKDMTGAWISFARSGRPELPAGPRWPRYTIDERATMLFGLPSSVELDPAALERQAWREP